MEIIPVIDLLDGYAVHARRGQRADYQPLQSALCPSSDPLAVTEILLNITKARCCYLADLDAIQEQGNQHKLIEHIATAFPEVEFWVDSGNYLPAQSPLLRIVSNVTTVVGSESFNDIERLVATLKPASPAKAILSLDFKNHELLGPSAILVRTAVWPHRVIVMDLDHVGSAQGPGLETILRITKPEHTTLYAAGGVRYQSDLQRLAEAGVSGVLVASALHSGTLFAHSEK